MKIFFLTLAVILTPFMRLETGSGGCFPHVEEQVRVLELLSEMETKYEPYDIENIRYILLTLRGLLDMYPDNKELADALDKYEKKYPIDLLNKSPSKEDFYFLDDGSELEHIGSECYRIIKSGDSTFVDFTDDNNNYTDEPRFCGCAISTAELDESIRTITVYISNPYSYCNNLSVMLYGYNDDEIGGRQHEELILIKASDTPKKIELENYPDYQYLEIVLVGPVGSDDVKVPYGYYQVLGWRY